MKKKAKKKLNKATPLTENDLVEDLNVLLTKHGFNDRIITIGGVYEYCVGISIQAINKSEKGKQ